jgi:hypothetical protein
MPTGIYPRKPRPEADPLPRFWSRVNRTETCWLWTGFLDRDGYGQFWYHGRNHPAHRVIFELLVRPLAEGEQALHRCDVRHCVRLDHLFPGTQEDNIRDCWAKRRASFNAKPQPGSKNGNSTLTEQQVREIRAKYRPSKAGHPSTTSFNALAREYGVSKFAIQYAVKHGWRHLSDSVIVVR